MEAATSSNKGYILILIELLIFMDLLTITGLSKQSGKEIDTIHSGRNKWRQAVRSTGFNAVAGYIFGKNSTMKKIPMTTHVFTQALEPELSEVSIQIVLLLEKDISW
ncbi:uncharacterized protein LOC111303242 [Durio zibethinus]|uniref:Uncharacterized protein LOC111303242 n=1 Tax=Durio zibethinus TaxID=66656 RepID=A0A6P5ZQF3_DURZI|nr:uncharacterized protein LOC111303242 [Durio zibethinus]